MQLTVRFVFTTAATFFVAAIFSVSSPAQNCGQTSVGTTPINDLGVGTYMGEAGGLYPGGSNVRPVAHETGGLISSSNIVPRDAAGAPDPVNGKIGFCSIGMSNTRNHFNEFVPLASLDITKSPQVIVFNAAQGGQPAEDIDDPAASYWSFVDARVVDEGLSAAQVQAVWLLQANRSPSTGFPAHALGLRDNLISIVQILHDRFPNLAQVHIGSRIYAGYATTILNPEPYSYEGGFAKKWLIEEQIGGNPALNWDASMGTVEAPWMAWGPYAWADGLTPRADGLIWECSDFNPDGTHPSPQGSQKMSALILAHMISDSSTTWWFGDGPDPTEPGVAFCFGEGGNPPGCTSCPCSNDAAAGSGTGCLNQSGTGARLTADGNPSVSADTLSMSFDGTNPFTFAILASGANQLPQNGSCPPGSGIVSFAFNGLRCIGGGAVRHGTRTTGPLGTNDLAWNPMSPPGGLLAQGGYVAGQSRHFQLFYREAPGGNCNAGQNTSNGYTIIMQP